MNKQIITISTIFSLLFGACQNTESPYSITYTSTYNHTVEVIKEKVGNELDIVIPAAGHPTISPQAIYLNGFSTAEQLDFSVVGSTLNVHIIEGLTQNSGTYYIEGLFSDTLTRLATLELAPEASSGLIRSYIDAKSIHTNSNEASTITSFPVDKFFNPTIHTETIQYNLSDGNTAVAIQKETTGSFSTLDIQPERNEKILVGAHTTYGNSKEQSIRVLTGCPASITINTERIYPVADGRQFFKVSTSPMKDNLGNTIEDGSLIHIKISNGDGNKVSDYKAISVNGVASSWIRNPIYEGTYFINAEVCGVKSNTLKVQFESLIEKFDYSWASDANNIKIGPVSSKLGQYVPNGTPLTVAFITEEGNQELTVGFKDGYAIIDLEKIWGEVPASATVEIYNRPFNIIKKG